MKIELKVPTSYDDITIGEYQSIQEIYERVKTKELAALECIALLCEVDKKKMRHIKQVDIDKVVSMMAFLWQPVDKSQYELKRTFTHEGVKYGFIPDMSNLSVGEFADLDNYANDEKNLHKVMSILYRPVIRQVGEFYDIEPYAPQPRFAETARNFPMSIAMGALVFFYAIAKTLSQDSETYLKGVKGTV